MIMQGENIDLDIRGERGRNTLPYAFLTVFSFALVFVCESIVRRGYFTVVFRYMFDNPKMFLINFAFFFLLSLFLSYITKRPYISVFAVSLFFITLAILEDIKLMLRFEPIYPWDLTILGEAIQMSGRTYFVLYSTQVMGVLFFLVTVLLWAVPALRRALKLRISPKLRVFGSAVTFVGLVVFMTCMMTTTFYIREGGRTDVVENAVGEENLKNGFVPYLLMNFRDVVFKAPPGYDRDSVINSAQSIIKDESATVTPNIIVLMSESFADITSAKGITVDSEKLTPNFNQIKESGISGNLLVNNFGGGTANCEYEVLTGTSMSFLPPGSTPYVQYIKGDIFSYPRYLKSVGYSASAVHSYIRHFWDRELVYGDMGFDRYVSAESFDAPEKERGLISDSELTKKIIDMFKEDRASGKKASFIFGVSVQNHGSYYENDFDQEEQFPVGFAEGVSAETRSTVQSYLTGVHKTDKALGELISYFKSVSEPTVIVFYGDHYPQIGQRYDAFKEIGYINDNQSLLEQNYKLHNPPFAVWNNFSDKKSTDNNISHYQLIPFVTEKLGIVRPTFFDYLNEQRKSYCGNAGSMYLDSEGKLISGLTEQQRKYMKTHELFSYDLLYGSGYAKEILQK